MNFKKIIRDVQLNNQGLKIKKKKLEVYNQIVNVNNHRVNCFRIQSSFGTCSVPMRKNADQIKSKYGHFS